MKALKSLWLGTAALGLATTASVGQITGSAHDFSSMAWSTGQICKPCHTPHNAITGMNRLWNHELTVANYEMHGGPGTAALDLDYRSRLCLSCHDGTVALDSFGGATGTSFMPGNRNLGTDLTNDHPVGRDAMYPPPNPPSYWNSAFRDPTTFPSSIKLQDWVDSGGVTRKVVGCTTCHNPHRKSGIPSLLNLSNTGSAVCLTCHIK